MKPFKYISALICSLFVAGACTGAGSPELYTISVEPYKPANEEEVRYSECTVTFGDEVSISGQGAWYKGSDIVISEDGIYRITGDYDGGCIIVNADGIVKIIFSDANISCPDGCVLVSSADRLIIASEGTSTITGIDDVRQAAVCSDGALLIVGTGKLSINGGVFSRGGIKFGRSVSTLCQILYTDDGEYIPDTLNINS